MPLENKSAITFDCFGTLIDWETGIWDAFQPLFRRAGKSVERSDALLWYAAAESEAESGSYQPYRSVLADVLRRVGARLECTPTQEELDAFSSSIENWPAFPDSSPALRALKRHFKLAVITNCDDDLFAEASKKLNVEFDHVITAQQAQSYKPSHRNFHVAVNRLGLPVAQIMHVACSLYHDHVPARQLGFTTAWINRRHKEEGSGATPQVGTTVKPDYVFDDMKSFVQFALGSAGTESLE